MRYSIVLLIAVGCFFTFDQTLVAQRMDRARAKLNQERRSSWPPEHVYSRISLGRALQGIFQKHYQYCGFAEVDGRRDYLPADIQQFLGKRALRTRVEQADFSGGSLLQYIFMADEVTKPLNSITFRPEYRLDVPGTDATFLIEPEAQFDSYVLTENCSGYLKAALDAGIEPPYSAFRTALDTDDRKESTVLAVSGTFRSPIDAALQARDVNTTRLLMELWQFYDRNPQYIGRAYYLQAFSGVMIKHTASAEEARTIENELGININGPFAAGVDAQFNWGRQSKASFRGTDWETIVFADFDEENQRQEWYAPLPGPAEISAYFADLRPTFERHSDFPLLTEGAEHRHYLRLEGIPAELARSVWEIEGVESGVYIGQPSLEARPFTDSQREGCLFTITGAPDPAIFAGPLAERPGKLSLSYQLRSRQTVGGTSLILRVQEELPTSTHPIISLADGQFDLSIKENRRFAFQWQVALEVEDDENPVDFSTVPYFSELQLTRADQAQALDVSVKEVVANPRKHQYVVTLETHETWPLQQINDRVMETYNLSCKAHVPAQRTPNRVLRPVKGFISFPRIEPLPPPTPVEAPLAPSPKGVIEEGGK